LSAETEDEASENIKKYFKENPDVSTSEAIERVRAPGFERQRLTALKAVAARDPRRRRISNTVDLDSIAQEGIVINNEGEAREFFRQYPDVSVHQMLDVCRVHKSLTKNSEGNFTTQRLAGIKAALRLKGEI
jgi:hypothetical protein